MAQQLELGLAAAFAACGVTRWVASGHALLAAALAALAWLGVLALKSRDGNIGAALFRGKSRGDVAYVGAAMVFFSAVAQPGGLLAAALLTPVAFVLFMDDALVLPDDQVLRECLAADKTPQSVEVADPTDPNSWTCTKPRRLVGHETELMRYHADCGEGVQTVRAVLDRARLLFPQNQLCGTRRVHEDGTFGPYEFIRYDEFLDKVARCEQVLLRRGDARVGLYAKNCEEYAVAMLAALHAGVVVVPLYDSLGHDSVRHIVQHAELATVFTSEENLENVLRLTRHDEGKETCERLRTIAVFRDRTLPASSRHRVDRGPRKLSGRLEVVPFETFLEENRSARASRERRVEPDVLAFILYTSGTTGVPKGVMLTHGSVIASASALCTSVTVHETDVHLSYLPLAHAFEIAVIIAGLMRGASVGWFHGNVKELTDDAKELKPTLFIGVPRVFQRVQQVILQQFALKPAPIRRLCYHAVRMQVKHVRETGRRLWYYDKLVFSQVKAALGGRVRIMCTGSAPLAPSVQEFIRVCFDLPTMVEGYGMTETSGVSHAMSGGRNGVFDKTMGHVGPPLACSEFKLESASELGYAVEDKPYPRGEVLVRGPNIFTGYYKDQALTNEVLVSGWLHTGDIGRINDNGTLSIIDRKKNIFKLAQGEYVAPESLETRLMELPVVGQVFVHGSPALPHLVAILVPDPLELVPRLKKGAVPGVPKSALPELSPDLDKWLGAYDALCQSEAYGPLIKAFLMSELTRACREAELPRFMWIRDVLVESKLNNLLQGFSIANGCLTPTFKIKRKGVVARYEEELEALLQGVPEKPPPASSYPPTSAART